MRLEFHTLDVFTDRVFGGNPLAVFPDGGGVPDETMQRVARELNLSETVFVTAPGAGENTFRVRIFTPATELPFAGHPSVGTAFLLAHLGRVSGEGPERMLVLEEGVGPVPVTVRMESGRPRSAKLTAARVPEFGPPPPAPEVLAELLSLSVGDLGGSLDAAQASAGVPFLFVPVRSRDALARVRINLVTWEREIASGWAPHVYVMTDDADDGAHLRVRMFAPAMGIAEDPATGGAAAALAALLARRDAGADGSHAWTVEQGIEMGRPSRLEVEADVAAGRLAAVRVGGSSVLVSHGTMTVPDE